MRISLPKPNCRRWKSSYAFYPDGMSSFLSFPLLHEMQGIFRVGMMLVRE